ncbi:7410_t:CDS:10 [Funneliformis mosseae]|uniref:7410_t:CDS:1 n=1 Tax=Funneliformis mosseae TaxID=27381 RepID=A0A9N9A8L3_FUNMO|nr:7410_t:CDS:10 [Funneliformis mosseae]
MKHNRKFSCSNHQANKSSKNNSSPKDKDSQELFEQQYIRQSLKSNNVEDFWHEIEVYTHEPEFFSFSGPNSRLTIKDANFIRKLISAAITMKRGGDLVPSLIAKRCCELYETLVNEDKIKFMYILARDFGVKRDEALKAANNYTNLSNEDAAYLKENNHEACLMALNESLKEKLSSLLVGFLDLRRITWYSSAAILEKVIEYEAVHAIKDWDDMKRRVGPGRRLFAFFYQNMRHEPLVFIQVALTKEVSDNVQAILEDPNPTKSIPTIEDIHCAIFYSITSQPGLSGIELGNFLIKRVVRELQTEFPSIKTFSTLSPIPGFQKWLNAVINVEGDSILVDGEAEKIKNLRRHLEGSGTEILKVILKSKDWIRDEVCFHTLKPILMRLCARYILTEKRRNLALDPVANFHIRNGACVHRLNWLGDISNKGLEESFGIMANYNYILDHIERNNQQYMCDGKISVSNVDPLLVEVANNSPNIVII